MNYKYLVALASDTYQSMTKDPESSIWANNNQKLVLSVVEEGTRCCHAGGYPYGKEDQIPAV